MKYAIGGGAVVSLFVLTGCAGDPVLEQRIGPALPDDVTASYDAGADTVTLSKSGAGSVTLAKAAFSPYPGGNIYYSSGLDKALRNTTGSGKGEFIVFASYATVLDTVGAIVTRAGAVNLPTSGTADYKGNYSGLEVYSDFKDFSDNIIGSACLTASFGPGPATIGGAITGRMSFINSVNYADIVIPATPLSADGTFTGPVTGGQAIGAGNTASNGQISGMFADVGAGEIVGALQLDHTISGTAYYEVGGFTTGPGACP